MATEDVNRQSTPNSFWLVLAVVAGAAALFAVWMKNSQSGPHSGLTAGSAAPNLQAAGWLNGDPPAPNPPPGKIRVLHAWFTTCPACYRESAELVRLHQKYAGQGVEFIGLTYEPADQLPEIKDYLAKTGITWVNGYGGLETLRQFGVEYFPSVWIINSEGEILWNLDSDRTLAEALKLAIDGKLAPKPASES